MAQRRRQSNVLARTDSLYIAPSRVNGHGVFAAKPFAESETIEVCPVLAVTADEWQHLEDTRLRGHYFVWGKGVALALGYGSLYNHSWQPNARYDADYDLAVISFTALRDIRRGEELTVNYCGEPDAVGELWFDAGAPPPA
jgi:SET domain-containing protein